ncbi:hypothetical protein [Nocardia aurantiaca]|uniref:Ferredoxin n=1 Tax=Nocardia aurantiaca TaxID=2675850 RepID=A0A6I3KXC4_9NOCA|nr:hypothetical protein [Nocardia aurantiaca]MTE13190.1 hypothetical protein [Nocardia aurantiaca]
MDQVRCLSCGTCVLVEKYSDQHTSVQWNRDAQAACTEMSNKPRAHTCHALRTAIDDAVASGALSVSTRDVDVRTRGRTLA